MDKTDTLVNASEAARIMEVDRSTFWLWRRQGKIEPTEVISGRAVFSVQYLKERAAALVKPGGPGRPRGTRSSAA